MAEFGNNQRPQAKKNNEFRERKIQTTFRWWNDDETEINSAHIERLDQHAEERIAEMRKEGYTSGELCEEIDGVEYRGWWEFSYIA